MVHAPAPAADAFRAQAGAGATDEPLASTKHEAAGNDFLVLVRSGATLPLSTALVRSLCDRRRGVGADGLLVARPGDADADVAMLLYNADGSRVEMSGNGIRCLVQAAVMAGMAPPGALLVRTDAGIRQVEYTVHDGVAHASVDMGEIALGDELESPLPGTRARRADVGNPHVVVVAAAQAEALAPGFLRDVDLPDVARAVTQVLGQPVNVEVVVHAGEDVLSLRVFERGVGETAACGTGSCAAAAVARGLGLVGDDVTVENPGGALRVRLSAAPGASAILSGPVRHVADVVVAPAAFERPVPA